MVSCRKSGFTLVELLVVIAIIGILVALLLPAIQAAREAARRSQCSNNVKQQAIALQNYHDVHKCFPSGGINPYAGINPANGWAINWAIAILPFVEQGPLYDQYNMNLSNNDAANAAVLQTIVPAYCCPSDVNATKLENPGSGNYNFARRHGSYAGVTGYTTGDRWFDCEQWRTTATVEPEDHKGLLHATGPNFSATAGVALDCERMSSVLDGTGSTLAIGESQTITTTSRGIFWGYTYTSYALRSFRWRNPETFNNDYTACGGTNSCKRAFGSMHPGGAQFALVDGSVRFISQSTDLDILCYMSSIAGRESTPMP
jgi:prepilin-type N-terminal cleavage/methylation domain-containing protein/prepilin-type processing-associated H-X9-DG protein